MKQFIIGMILLLPMTLWGQQPFFFIQVTDPQLGMIENNKGFAQEVQLVEKAVDIINQLCPEFVVFTGDLVNDGMDKAQIQEFKRLKALIRPEIPVYLLPGNHDVGNEATDERVSEYIREYGYDRFTFRVQNCCFIGINTELIWAQRTEKANEQYDWMKSALKQAQECTHRIVFGHHPLFLKTPDEADKYENIPQVLRRVYLDLYQEEKVEYMFAGHLHYNAFGTNGNFKMITTSAIGKQLKNDKSGFQLVKVYADRVEPEYIDLDNPPAIISFN